MIGARGYRPPARVPALAIEGAVIEHEALAHALDARAPHVRREPPEIFGSERGITASAHQQACHAAVGIGSGIGEQLGLELVRRTEGFERGDRRQQLQIGSGDHRPIGIARVELATPVALDDQRGHARPAQTGRRQRGVETRDESVGRVRRCGERANKSEQHAADLRLLRRHGEPDEERRGASLDARQLIREPAAEQSSGRAIGAMGGAVLNGIWLGLILIAVVYGAFTGRMPEVSKASFEGAKSAVQLVIGLTGFMVFVLGLMRVATDGGLLRAVARWIAPLMRRLFPDVPAEHPAMTAMVMNFATNVLGLGNAATPFGLKAMRELETLNRHPGVASDAMVLFLSINATAITLMLPTGTMAVRAAAGSTAPAAIWVPTLIATTCSTSAAVAVFYLLRRWPRYAYRPLEAAAVSAAPAAAKPATPDSGALERSVTAGSAEPAGPARRAFIGAVALALLLGLAFDAMSQLETQTAGDVAKQMLESWLFPLLIVALLLVGVAGRVRVYESMIEGAKEGLEVVVRILPYLIAILVAVAMFRASGALESR